MQCKCCKHQVADGNAICDVCKFPMVAGAGVNMEGYAQQFRSTLLNGCSISIKVYHYDSNGSGKLVEQKSEYVKIADALVLPYRQVLWFGDEFNPPAVMRDIELNLRVSGQGKSLDITVTAALNKSMKCARLGLYLDDGFAVRVAVGTPEDYVLSDDFSILD